MKHKLLSLFLITSYGAFAQIGETFTKRVEKETRGEMILISNNILNGGKKPNSPYNDTDEDAKQNDEFKMRYIDIDNDKSTFSSSSADFNVSNPNAKIIYAGIYWAATYKYEEGKLNYQNHFVAKNKKRHSFDKIKIKFPNQNSYVDIEGEIIFDGNNSSHFGSNAPYAAYADITKYVQTLSQTNGTYTVANIRATQGLLSGGSSAGWTIVFIIEDTTKDNKYFTVYDGFAGVSNQSVNVEFSGFQALPEGNVNASIYGSALEGDLNMEGDQLLIKSDTTGEFINLESGERTSNNFFNSSITLSKSGEIKRNPNSKNTLGYDTFDIVVDNPQNNIIGNNAEEVTLKLLSSGDRYFMFMTAFDIQVSEPEITPDLEMAFPESIVTNAKNDTEDSEMRLLLEKEKEEAEKNHWRIEPIESPSVPIEMVKSGYYIVAGVFAVPSNATRFVSTLQNKECDANFFYNPTNKYRYVFLAHSTDFEEASKIYHSDVNGKYKDELWIMSVNTEYHSIVYANRVIQVPYLKIENVTPIKI